MFYTNADQFLNKRDELYMRISGQEPDIIMLTEVIPKAQSLPIAKALLSIPGYSVYMSFDPSLPNLGMSGNRGICIYIRSSLKTTEVSFGMSTYVEQQWVKLPLVGNDSLLIGCIYRSPSQTLQDCSEELCRLLHTASTSGPSHILISGDFNMPNIDWENKFSPAPPTDISHKFLEALDDCFLSQHVTEPTRFRPGETPHTLDLIFSNEEGMVRNLCYESGLGKSDHVVLRFDLACYTRRQEECSAHPNYFKGDPARFIKMVSDVDWDSPSALTVDQKFAFMCTTLKKLALICFPKSKRKVSRRNIYMNGQALRMKKRKEQLWRVYLHSRDALDYCRYVRCRNQLRTLTRNLRKRFEEKLAQKIKVNPKSF